jgi:DNA invertase Pin-like site-specific DNA recombinase
MSAHSTSPVAFSYIRFSHPSQSEGDSLRRQTQAAADWCKRNGAVLDTATTFRDLGKSAYSGTHRANPDRHALAAFLKLVESGKVSRGSYLIIENLDRLSREHIQPALLLALNLLQSGVRIVQLKPAEMVFDDKSDTLPVMMMIFELSRGHSESAIKSERVGAAWSQKRQQARAGGVLTRRLPGWIELRDGKLSLVPQRAAVLRRIFELAAAGYGYARIVQRLELDRVPTFGAAVVREGRKRGAFARHWTLPYVVRILNDRRAVGEYQPCGRGRKPEGPPITDYYPAAVTEEEFWAARRKVTPSRKAARIGKHSNLFAGLIKNARDGESYIAATKKTRILLSRGSQEGRSPAWSFPLKTFEEAALSLLKEIDPREVLGRGDDSDNVSALEKEQRQIESSIAMLEAELNLHGDSPALYRRLRAKEDEKKAVVARLIEARQKAAHPLHETWEECKTLIDALENAPDPEDARMRLRAALHRIVSEIRLLVVPRGLDRLAAVQFFFADGKHVRTYAILHRPAKASYRSPRVEGKWWARSLAEVVKVDALDLRRREDAAELAADLAALDLDAVQRNPPEQVVPS